MDYLLNTNSELAKKYNYDRVLNLIINGLPSKLYNMYKIEVSKFLVF